MKILSIAIIFKLAVIVTAADCEFSEEDSLGYCKLGSPQPYLWNVSMFLNAHTSASLHYHVSLAALYLANSCKVLSYQQGSFNDLWTAKQ